MLVSMLVSPMKTAMTRPAAARIVSLLSRVVSQASSIMQGASTAAVIPA